MKQNPKQRTRFWVTGTDEYRRQWNEWAKAQGFIAEDLARKLFDRAMAHGKISFDVECGYGNSQSETDTQ